MKIEMKLVRAARCIVFMSMLTVPVFAVAQVETIDATARGTSTQLGTIGSIKVIISRFSTPEERDALKDAPS